MSESNHYRPMVATAAIVSLAWAIVWSSSPLLGSSSRPIRIGVLGTGVLLACAGAAFFHQRRRNELRRLARYFDSFDPGDDCDQAATPETPRAPLPRTSPWRELAEQTGQILTRQNQRLAELNQARTAQEIRSRRVAAECERVKTVLASVADPILVVNHYDELLLANPAAEELFHFDACAAEKRAVAQLVRCERLLQLLNDSAHHEAPSTRSEELQIADAAGNANWYRVSTSGLADSEDGSSASAIGTSGAVAVLRDISAHKAMQKRNAEFVSSVSHEMKTPLASIRAYVELLVDGDADDEATREEFLQVINSQADRLQRLVENLLNLARIEAGVVQVNKQSRPLNEILDEAARVVQPSAEAKRIQLVTDLSPLFLGVLADRDMLLQAVINLLSNAVKYTPEGGRVTLRSRSADDEVLFEVEDTGVGLNEEDSQRVFEKFYRVRKDQNMASGTGLGLPLAKHIVEDVHGGRLTLKSKLGEGSTFTVMLPRATQMK